MNNNNKSDILVKYFRSLSEEINNNFSRIQNSTTHPDAKGKGGEDILAEFLRGYLDNFYKIYTRRQIIDYKRNITSQFDVIIVHKNVLLSGIIDSSSGYLFAESVAGVFEVKSRLTRKYIEESIDKMQILDELEQTSMEYDQMLLDRNRDKPIIRKYIFAYDSSITPEKILNELEGLNDILDVIVVHNKFIIFRNDPSSFRITEGGKSITPSGKYLALLTEGDTLLVLLIHLNKKLDKAILRRIDTGKYFESMLNNPIIIRDENGNLKTIV